MIIKYNIVANLLCNFFVCIKVSCANNKWMMMMLLKLLCERLVLFAFYFDFFDAFMTSSDEGLK